MSYWKDLEKIKDSGVLVEGAIYLCFRPDVIFDDHTDRSIKTLTWDGKRFTGGCHSVKSVLLINELPDGYTDSHALRDVGDLGKVPRPTFNQ